MPTRRRKIIDKTAHRALYEAELRYGPQASALTQLLGQLGGERDADLTGSKEGSRMISESANQAIPELQKLYAPRPQSGVESMLAADIAKLGDQGTPYKLAFNVGTSGADARRAESGSEAIKGMVGRREGAITGGVMERRGIRSRYASDAGKVRQQLQDVVGQSGLYAQTRYGQLEDDARKLNLETRKQRADERDKRADNRRADEALDETRRHNTASEQAADERARNKGKGSKPKWATPAQQSDAARQIARALREAKALGGRDRAALGDILVTGAPSQKKNGQTVPGIPAFSELYVTAALDLYFGKGLHPNTIRKLHENRIKVKPLGYPRYTGPGSGRPYRPGTPKRRIPT